MSERESQDTASSNLPQKNVASLHKNRSLEPEGPRVMCSSLLSQKGKIVQEGEKPPLQLTSLSLNLSFGALFPVELC